MSQPDAESQKGLFLAFELAMINDIAGARKELGTLAQFTDDQLLEGLISLKKGLDLFNDQKQVEALEHLQAGLPLVMASDDDEAKLIVPVLSQFSEGIDALFRGDAHTAANLLNVSADTVDRIAFFMPNFKYLSLSMKAASLIAVARSYMNAADMEAAEKFFAEATEVHDELLTCLDKENADHLMGFGEVYGTRLEMSFTFIMSVDLPALDLDMWKKRLDMSVDDCSLLKQILDQMPRGRITSLLSQYPVIHEALRTLHDSLEAVILNQRVLTELEVKTLVNVDNSLFTSQQIAQKIGERGKGVLYQIKLMRRLQKNALEIGNTTASKDFGRYSGVVSGIAFIVLIIVMHLTVQPTGWNGLYYYLGGLLLALVVGFGYGALKFKPLLKIFSKAIKRQADEDKESDEG